MHVCTHNNVWKNYVNVLCVCFGMGVGVTMRTHY